jgi:aminoglycoside phosphotransferase (APT) family kinase protein
MAAGAVSPAGLDLKRLAPLFQTLAQTRALGPLHAELIAGGKSNLTYQVTDGVDEWVLRRPPLGHVLATAHDMEREYKAITAISKSQVPVPQPLLLCTDPAVIGAPFYVMSRVVGRVFRTRDQMSELDSHRCRSVALSMIDTLVSLHCVDPLTVGLADFGRPEGFLERQVARWARQLASSRSRPLAGADELLELLRRPPASPAPALIHGDFKLDNLMINDADQVVAVLDWEMATLGDPLTDLALLAVYRDLDAIDPAATKSAFSAPGFPTTDELVQRYSDRTGLDVSSLDYYLGLAHFKLAVIVEGIHFRFVSGLTSGDGFADVGTMTEPLIKAGITAMGGR